MRHALVTALASAALTFVASGQTTWYVDDDNCPGPGSGSEADPFCAIQDGIDAAVDGDEVVVAPGEYFENEVRFHGKSITVRSEAGPDSAFIQQSFDPVYPGHTIMIFDSGEGPSSVLEGFTIRYGGPSWPEGHVQYGGGIRISSSPTIRQCFIKSNAAGGAPSCSPGYGGGVSINGGGPTFEDCVIQSNSATGYFCSGVGGGVYCSNASPTFVGCEFLGNTADAGAGLAIGDSTAVLLYCTFIANDVWWTNENEFNGAGISTGNSTLLLLGCVFASNFANEYAGQGGAILINGSGTGVLIASCRFTNNFAFSGAGIASASASPTIVNCTFAGNEAVSDGGAVASDGAVIKNSILWNDAPDEISGSASAIYSNVLGGWDGPGNLDLDPQFVDGYHLAPSSPCIDAGSTDDVPPEMPTDLDGNPRVVGVGVDMGAYEFQGLPCPADLDGDGTVGVTDLTAVILAWGTPGADVNGDGTTDVQDLVAVISAWGPCG